MHHLKPALLALLAQAPAHAGAFVAPPPRLAGDERIAIVVGSAPRSKQAAAAAASSAATPVEPIGSSGGTCSLFAGAVVAGAVAAVFGRWKGASRDGAAGCGLRVTRGETPEWHNTEEDATRGPQFKSWIWKRRHARKDPGKRQRYFKQQYQLQRAGVWAGYRRFHTWRPSRDTENPYKGPDSHPDNPWFPAASGGFPMKMQAFSAAAPVPLLASTPQVSAGLFAGGAAPTIGLAKKRLARGTFGAGRAERRGLVLKAHKKAASSTKNQGHNSNNHHYGITRKGYQGNAVVNGQLICKQKGMRWYPGANVKRCRDHRLVALKDGIVQWRGTPRHKEVFVVPWEYVREKCEWISPCHVAPKQYEPWMGIPHTSHRTHKETKGRTLIRNHVAKLRGEWLETEEGKEWADKKAEKKQKQKEIQKRIRAHVLKRREGTLADSPKDEVAASSAGESESEAES